MAGFSRGHVLQPNHEVTLVKRIERGPRAVTTALSRSPSVARQVIELGEKLRQNPRSVRKLVTVAGEDLTEEGLGDAAHTVLTQIAAIREALADVLARRTTLGAVPKRYARPYRRAQWEGDVEPGESWRSCP